MLNVQADLRARLAEALAPVEVRVDPPKGRPPELVTVSREGGRRVNAVLDAPGIGIYCYAQTEARAQELSEAVDACMRSLAFADGYEVVECEAIYSDPDPDSRSPRWYLSYSLVTH